MKRTALAIAVILTLAMIPVGSMAQSKVILSADIPFEFTVQGRTFDRGTYLVEWVSDHTQRIHSTKNTDSIYYLTNSLLDPKADLGNNKLVFHRYGSEYILAEVWRGNSGEQLRTSKHEIELAKANQMKTTTVQMEVGK